MKKCTICGLEVENSKVFSNHIRWQHLVDRNSLEFENFRKRCGAGKALPRITKQCKCPKCGNLFEQTAKESDWKAGRIKTFCSRKCSNSREFSEAANLARSQKAKENPSGFAKPGFVASETARKNHSKQELEIVRYLKDNFRNDEWKVGLIDGSKKHNGFYLCPDVWSKKLKVVVEYDGVWHFKNIHNQLERKQAVDRELYRFCKEEGYRLIRVDEDLKIDMQKIVDAIYNSKEPLELFGSKRYDYMLQTDTESN